MNKHAKEHVFVEKEKKKKLIFVLNNNNINLTYQKRND